MDRNKLDVSTRHRQEWESFRPLLQEVINDRNAELAKAVKAIADILKVYQEGERKAWGFADGEVDTETSVQWEGE